MSYWIWVSIIYSIGIVVNEDLQLSPHLQLPQAPHEDRNHPRKTRQYALLSNLELVALRKKFGNQTIAEVKVDDACLGMRGLPVMLYDGSSLDPIDGITFRGHSIPEFCSKAQKAPGGK